MVHTTDCTWENTTIKIYVYDSFHEWFNAHQRTETSGSASFNAVARTPASLARASRVNGRASIPCRNSFSLLLPPPSPSRVAIVGPLLRRSFPFPQAPPPPSSRQPPRPLPAPVPARSCTGSLSARGLGSAAGGQIARLPHATRELSARLAEVAGRWPGERGDASQRSGGGGSGADAVEAGKTSPTRRQGPARLGARQGRRRVSTSRGGGGSSTRCDAAQRR